MTTTVQEMDLRPGGPLRTLMRDPEGKEYPDAEVFLEVTAPERIVVTDAFEPGWIPTGKAFMCAIWTGSRR
jgi:uncharacterized protein YndB with AHSA1/START domain